MDSQISDDAEPEVDLNVKDKEYDAQQNFDDKVPDEEAETRNLIDKSGPGINTKKVFKDDDSVHQIDKNSSL